MLEESLPPSLRSLLARRRGNLPPEQPVRILRVWRPDPWAVRLHRCYLHIPWLVVCGLLIFAGVLLSALGPEESILPALALTFLGTLVGGLGLLAASRYWITRGVLFQLTEDSLRVRVGKDCEEVLLDWIDSVEVFRTNPSRDYGHVILWSRGATKDRKQTLRDIDRRFRSPLSLSSLRGSAPHPIVLFHLRGPNQVAALIERARNGLPLQETSAYR